MGIPNHGQTEAKAMAGTNAPTPNSRGGPVSNARQLQPRPPVEARAAKPGGLTSRPSYGAKFSQRPHSAGPQIQEKQQEDHPPPCRHQQQQQQQRQRQQGQQTEHPHKIMLPDQEQPKPQQQWRQAQRAPPPQQQQQQWQRQSTNSRPQTAKEVPAVGDSQRPKKGAGYFPTLSSNGSDPTAMAAMHQRPSSRGPLLRRLLTKGPPRILAAPGQSVLKDYIPSVASGVVLSLNGALATRSRPGTRNSFGHGGRHSDMDSELQIQSTEQLAATLHRRTEEAWDTVSCLFAGHDPCGLGLTCGSSPRASPVFSPSREGLDRKTILPNLTDQEHSLNLVESSLAFLAGLEALQKARDGLEKEIISEEGERQDIQVHLADCSAALESVVELLAELREEREENEARLKEMVREHSLIVEASRNLLDVFRTEQGKLDKL